MVLDQWHTPTKKTSHKSNPIGKLSRAYRIPIVSGKGKLIDETLEKTMDAIGNDNITLKKVSRLWSIP
jgi:hypothetical protein